MKKAPKSTQGEGTGHNTIKSYLVTEGTDQTSDSPSQKKKECAPTTPVKNKVHREMDQNEEGTPGKGKDKSKANKARSPEVKGQSKDQKTPERQQQLSLPRRAYKPPQQSKI